MNSPIIAQQKTISAVYTLMHKNYDAGHINVFKKLDALSIRHWNLRRAGKI